MKLVRKPRATAAGCNPYKPEMVRPVGQRPKPDRTQGGACLLRDWQTDAILALQSQSFVRLIAPTGSGKSVVQKALVYLKVKAGAKVIIAVPEASIGGSFESEGTVYRLPKGLLPEDESKMQWLVSPSNFLFDLSEKSVVEQILSFVKTKKVTESSRVLVCTHQALVMAHHRLIREHKGRGSPWKGVSLAIDEAHRTRFLDWEGSAKEWRQQEDRFNKLGALVEHYVQKKPGSLMLATATWLRGDQASIVPDKYSELFTHYELSIDRYLDEMQHLKEIAFKLSLQDYPAVMRKEVRGSRQKTLVYLPPVVPGAVQTKHTTLRQLRGALGSRRASSNGFTEVHRGGLHSLDLVTQEGRRGSEGRLSLWLKDKNTTDVIFAQNLFRIGTDWPALERSYVLGFRKSLPMVIQMLGRLLRDYPGKRRVEFHMVLPKTVTTDVESFWNYANAIFMVMALGWQFSVQVSGSRSITLRTSEVIQHLNLKLVQGILSEAYDGVPTGEALRSILKDVVREAHRNDGDGGEAAVKSVTTSMVKGLQAAMSQTFRMYLHQLGDALKEYQRQKLQQALDNNTFKVARDLFDLQFGPEILRDLRNYVEAQFRTIEGIKADILRYFKQNQKRPPHASSKEWVNNEAWLRRRGSSLRQLCDELGLPGPQWGRTLKAIQQDIRQYYKQHKKRPFERSSQLWLNHNSWLRRQGSSLRQLCDEMGLPEERSFSRTVKSVERELTLYYKRYKRRPTEEESPFWTNHNNWLRKRGSSLRKLCNELGIPGGKNLDRTIESVKADLLEYHTLYKTRPTIRVGNWRDVNDWLYHQGSSLQQLCDALGLSGGQLRNRTLVSVQRDVQEFYTRQGEYPTRRTSEAWANANGWLRRQGTSLHKLCRKMGLK